MQATPSHRIASVCRRFGETQQVGTGTAGSLEGSAASRLVGSRGTCCGSARAADATHPHQLASPDRRLERGDCLRTGPVARPRTTPRREDPWRAGCGRPIFPAGSANGREQTASTTGPRPSRALPTAIISLERQIQRVSGESWRLQYGANFSDSIDVVRPHSGGNDEKARGSTWSDVAVLEMK